MLAKQIKTDALRLSDTHSLKFVDNFRKRKALRFDTQISLRKRLN